MLRDAIVLLQFTGKLIRWKKALPHLDMDKQELYGDASTLGYGKLRVGTFDLFYPYPSGETLNEILKKVSRERFKLARD